ncbi:glycogen/starch/alpha-glucan phosphorylase [Paenibacillus solani]|uniref:Alpha-1,4 glucan phosphorylase n=1 Tax=Paenibacillus solani TaxID=1705565 RepID=A0A0M1P0X8_9BACL|nr:glycogen/starch/alpha-glucan phosphorylase [Paenibacillus solani]KOR88163.1 maltodextrin phosphorylase [Paenibacillus solani]
MFNNLETFKQVFTEHLVSRLGKGLEDATAEDVYKTLGGMIREYVGREWAAANRIYRDTGQKQVYYFSLEFLIGRLMGNNLLNLEVLDMVRRGLLELGWNLEEIEEQEPDAGLGNGGLGRLAACFLDSLASLSYAGHGCGIRYKYGLFEQKIVDGHQVELPDNWLQRGNVWEERRADKAVDVRFWGHVEVSVKDGRTVFDTVDYERVLAVPYDVPVIGYGEGQVNTLRLWSAEPASDISRIRPAHSQNSYYKFLEYNRSVESISEFLYPDDSAYEGKLLRLKQQYFLCSAGVQSILRTFDKLGRTYHELPEYVAIHINDTHPTLVIPELMRILIDDKGLGWDEAWDITSRTVSYTNHTLLSEALEKWPIGMVRDLLPRIYMIIEEINKRFCGMLLERYPNEHGRISQLAIIESDQIRMANLAIVGSYHVNGVAALHTELLKTQVMKPHFELYPERFSNKTNGITHRRWLMHSNPGLSRLISEGIGTSWITDPCQLIQLQSLKNDSAFRQGIQRIKRSNKQRLADFIADKQGILINPDSIFDVHVKRLHGYKRQLLNILRVMHVYNEIKDQPNAERVPRTVIFGAKAAPGYYLAKSIIKLINVVADVVNNDPQVNDKLQVLFLENYSVSLAEKIIPAADVSEQISTAGKEASGTGNMKFMMNGALTIGTLDGANVEMFELLGKENMFLFGLKLEEVLEYYRTGAYVSRKRYEQDPRINRVLNQLISPGPFCCHELEFGQILQSLLDHNDEFFVLEDFASYVATQSDIDQAYLDADSWAGKSIVNIAHSGHFSSDNTIHRYAAEIWNISPVKIGANR